MFHIPHDSRAVYRAIPARAAATLRVIDLPERWEGLVANPLVASALRTAGTEPDDALWLVRDPATRAWFDRLAGREALLAWLPAQEGQPPALLAASWLGGQAPLLRQELLLFRLPDFQRMPTAFPGRAVWRVKGLDLPRGWSLTLSFADGLLLACLSPNPWAIGELLGAHDGTFSRLLDAGIGFDALAARDDRSIPLQLWIRDDWPTPAASASVSAAPPAASPPPPPPPPSAAPSTSTASTANAWRPPASPSTSPTGPIPPPFPISPPSGNSSAMLLAPPSSCAAPFPNRPSARPGSRAISAMGSA